MSSALNTSIFEHSFDASWRFECICHLGGMLGDYALPSGLDDSLDGWQSEEAFPVLGLPAEAVDWERDEVIEWLRENRKFGFFVQVATPVREYFSEDSCSLSWGAYRTQWIYDEDFRGVVRQARKWVRETDRGFRDAWRAKNRKVPKARATKPARKSPESTQNRVEP